MNRKLVYSLTIAVLAIVLALGVCVASAEEMRIKLATTTSTDNSGLLAYLLPEFEKASGYKVDVIAVGTGKAIRHGENGDVDVILVHAPAAEQAFVDSGFGVQRVGVMENDFIILGPADDPAGIKGLSVTEAFAKLAASGQPFISRGDDSGTHKKELLIWAKAEIEPKGDWYMEAGQGMGACLTIADEKKCYVLADRGTYLARKKGLDIVVLNEGDPLLANPYAIIAVNPAKHPHVNTKGAQSLIDWITSPAAQQLIGDFRVDDEVLFKPTAAAQK
ncbi:MAG: substrate-binding domain-containing protein [Candidatus Alcyoniella australis]|nr:substrate-binding domain-containing protein [Candidatus Alcyoniella australis]